MILSIDFSPSQVKQIVAEYMDNLGSVEDCEKFAIFVLKNIALWETFDWTNIYNAVEKKMKQQIKLEKKILEGDDEQY